MDAPAFDGPAAAGLEDETEGFEGPAVADGGFRATGVGREGEVEAELGAELFGGAILAPPKRAGGAFAGGANSVKSSSDSNFADDFTAGEAMVFAGRIGGDEGPEVDPKGFGRGATFFTGGAAFGAGPGADLAPPAR